MSTPILPFAMWESGTNQNSVPANDNSLRNQILGGLIISDSTTAQPGSPADGDAYVIPAAATGTQWATFDEFDLAIFDSGTWYAFAPVEGIRVNIAGTLRAWDGAAYTAISGLPDAPSDGTSYVRKDGAWVAETSGGGGTPPIVTESTTALTADASNDGNYTRFTNASAKAYTFDDAETYTAGDEYHGRNVGAGDLTITEAGGMTINPPAGGTLVIPQGGTFTVKIVDADEADLFGVTVPL